MEPRRQKKKKKKKKKTDLKKTKVIRLSQRKLFLGHYGEQ